MQDVIIKITTSDKELDSTINKLVKMGVIDDSNAKKFKANNDKVNKGLKKTEGLLERARRLEKKLTIAREKANNTTSIKTYTRAIDVQRKKIRQLTGETNKQASSMSKLSSLAGSLGLALGAAFVVREIFNFGKELRDLSMQMELVNKKSTIVFGDELERVRKIADETANSLGLTTTEFIAAAAATQDLLVPLKFSREEAAGMSTDLVKLSGALSEWSAGKYDATEISEILTKAMLGEVEQLKVLGIKVDQTSQAYNRRVKTMVAVEGLTLEQAKATEILNQIMGKSVDAQEEFANGQVSMARKAAMNNATLREQKEILAKELTPVWGVLEDAWTKAIVEGQKKLVDFSKGIGGIKDAFNSWLKDIKAGITALTGYKFAEKEVIDVNKQLEESEGQKAKRLAESSGETVKATKTINMMKLALQKLKEQYASTQVGTDEFFRLQKEISKAEAALKRLTGTEKKRSEKKTEKPLFDEGALAKLIAKATEEDEKEITDIIEKEAKRRQEIKQQIRDAESDLIDDDIERQKKKLEEKYADDIKGLNDNLADEHELMLLKKRKLEDDITAIDKAGHDKRAELDKQAIEEKLIRQVDAVLLATEIANTAYTAINDLANINTNKEISRLEEQKELKDERLEEEKQEEADKFQQQFDDRIISEEELKEALEGLDQKYGDKAKKARDKADKQIAEEKTKAFNRNRTFALAQVAIDIATSIIASSKVGYPAAFATVALSVATGIAQSIVISNQQAPKFAKGTKGKQGSGMAIVGEEGEEAVFLPHGAKVVPNRQTKEYSGIIDSMIDGNLDSYLMKSYIPKMLPKAKPDVNSQIIGSLLNQLDMRNNYQQRDIQFPKGFRVTNPRAIAKPIMDAINEANFLNQNGSWG